MALSMSKLLYLKWYIYSVSYKKTKKNNKKIEALIQYPVLTKTNTCVIWLLFLLIILNSNNWSINNKVLNFQYLFLYQDFITTYILASIFTVSFWKGQRKNQLSY